MKILVDTNVFLDFLLNRDLQGEDAESFFKICRSKNHSIYLTSMQLRDIEYFAHRQFHNSKDAKKILEITYSLITKCLSLSADNAINSIYADYKDFEDQLLIEAAEENLMDCIVTDNINDFVNNEGTMPLFTPKSFVETCSN